MKETKKPVESKKAGYKAANKVKFQSCFNSKVPGYEGLCKGESVSFDESSPLFKSLLENKIIIKE
tara:strand:- start:896 stop:1090 length:195 start_codon:yes stop_codon:yes gene_type:complete